VDSLDETFELLKVASFTAETTAVDSLLSRAVREMSEARPARPEGLTLLYGRSLAPRPQANALPWLWHAVEGPPVLGAFSDAVKAKAISILLPKASSLPPGHALLSLLSRVLLGLTPTALHATSLNRSAAICSGESASAKEAALWRIGGAPLRSPKRCVVHCRHRCIAAPHASSAQPRAANGDLLQHAMQGGHLPLDQLRGRVARVNHKTCHAGR